MIYAIVGENSYEVHKKINQLRAAFSKKNGASFLIDRMDESEKNIDRISEILGGNSLFSKARLAIFKNVVASSPEIFKLLEENAEMLKNSANIFVFCEKSLDEEQKSFFKKYAEKIQEVRPRSSAELASWLEKESKLLGLALSFGERTAIIDTLKDGGEITLHSELEKIYLGMKPALQTSRQNSTIFNHADKIFSNHPLAALKESLSDGFDSINILNVLMWKLKNIFLIKKGESKSLNPYVARKTAAEAALFTEEKILDAFWNSILTDSELKRDSKNANEHLERFVLDIKK